MSGGLRRLVVGVLLVIFTSRADAALFGSVPQTPQTPHPAVCRVAVEERDGMAFGSGTLIDSREAYGLVVTNWHVVHAAKGKIEVRFPDGFTSEARSLKLDETWDLAALVVWRPPVAPVRLAMAPPQPGDRLTICGYGQGNYLQQTGRCTDYYSPEIGEPQEIVELNVQARQGDSGGPIFNDRGELAGVLFGAARGTTLGSFGGRVRTFLATLAPDIGSAQRAPTMLAQASPPAALVSPARTAAVDPFLAAEGAALRPLQPAPNPPASLSDRSSAPQLAAAHHSTEAFSAPTDLGHLRGATSHHSAEAWKPTGGFEPGSGAATPTPTRVEVSPQIAKTPVEISVAPAGETLDWYEEGRTLLALVGIAAIVMTGLRTLS